MGFKELVAAAWLVIGAYPLERCPVKIAMTIVRDADYAVFGYSTGLLCHRLGPDHVVSVEVDPAVAARTRAGLARVGFELTVVVADGLVGYPAGAPYDPGHRDLLGPTHPAGLDPGPAGSSWRR